MRKSGKNFILFAVLSIFFAINYYPTKAAPVYDQTNGSWSDAYADSTGVASSSGTVLNTTTTVMQLSGSGGSVSAPFATSGYYITTQIAPTSVAKWGFVTVSSTVPAGTSIKVQVMGSTNTAYSDSLLSGNSAGIASSSIDISSIPVEQSGDSLGNGKFGILTLKISFISNSTSSTPSVDALSLSWTVKQGDLSSSTIANTAWPEPDGDRYGTRHSNGTIGYPAVRWANFTLNGNTGAFIRGAGNNIYYKAQGAFIPPALTNLEDGYLAELNKNTGSTIWQRNISGFSFTSLDMTLSQNNTLYSADQYNDVFTAYDALAGTLKWTHQFTSGHGDDRVALGGDGTIYTIRDPGANASQQVYAFNPDGSIKWIGPVLNATTSVGYGGITVGRDGKLYWGTFSTAADGSGKLFAFNSTDGSIAWTYPAGDLYNSTPLVDSAGTIYVANKGTTNLRKSIFAINQDGSLKWQFSIGTSTSYWKDLSLRSDGVLMAERVTSIYPSAGGQIDAIDASNGNFLWSAPLISHSNELITDILTDAANGTLVNTINYTVSTTLAYYDSSGNRKWSLARASGANDLRLSQFIADESGNLFGSLLDNTATTSAAFGVSPWTISAAISPGSPVPGNTVNFSVTTSMQQADALTGSANQIQIIMDDNSKIPLQYSSKDSNGDTVWTGSWVAGGSTGSRSFTVEANAADINTDIPVHFASPALNSGNTGFAASVNFTLVAPAPLPVVYVGGPAPTLAQNSSGGWVPINQATSSLPGATPTSTAASSTTLPSNADLRAEIISMTSLLNSLIAKLRNKKTIISSGAEPLLNPTETPLSALTLPWYSKSGGVKALQEFLIEQGSGDYAKILKKIGASGYFGKSTIAAMIEFQKETRIFPASGIFGPKTKSYLRSLGL